MEPRVIQHLHALAQGGTSGDAGAWKRKDNEIIEILPSGDRRVRFKPTAAKATPKAVAQLCRDYHATCDGEPAPALITVGTFVFDFLCIHPFRDGNGRVSRLVTTMLLLEHGFEVVRYISLERLVEERRSEYYGVLEQCPAGFLNGTACRTDGTEAANDLGPKGRRRAPARPRRWWPRTKSRFAHTDTVASHSLKGHPAEGTANRRLAAEPWFVSLRRRPRQIERSPQDRRGHQNCRPWPGTRQETETADPVPRNTNGNRRNQPVRRSRFRRNPVRCEEPPPSSRE